MKKRLLSFLLSAALILSVLPLGKVSVSAAEHNPDYTHKYTGDVGVKDRNTTVYSYKALRDSKKSAQLILDSVTEGAEDLSPTFENVQNNTLVSKGYVYDESKEGYTVTDTSLDERITRVLKNYNKPTQYYYFPSLLIKDIDGDLNTTDDQTYPQIEENENSGFNGFTVGSTDEADANLISRQYLFSANTLYFNDKSGQRKPLADLGSTIKEGEPYAYEEVVYNLSSLKKLTDIVVARQWNSTALSTSNYRIYISENGTDYTEVYNYERRYFSATPLFEVIHFNTPANARCIKLQILNPVEDNCVGKARYMCATRISSFKVFGYEYSDVETTAKSYIKDYNGVATEVHSYLTDNLYRALKRTVTAEGATQIGKSTSSVLLSRTSCGYKYDTASGTHTALSAGKNILSTRVEQQEEIGTKANQIINNMDNSHVDFQIEGVQYGYAKSGGVYKPYRYETNGGNKIFDFSGTPLSTLGNEPYIYEDLDYTFNEYATVSDIAVGNHSNNLLFTSNYKVYVGNDRNKLTEVFHYDITNYSDVGRIQIIHFPEPISAKYVRIRVLDPTNGNNLANGTVYNKTRMFVQVYGVNTSNSDSVTVKNSADGSQLPLGKIADDFYSLSEFAGASNLHFNQYNSSGLPIGGDLTADTADKKKLFDAAVGNARFKAVWSESDRNTEWHANLYYDLGSVCDIKEIVINHSDEQPLCAFEVYASENLYNLYNGKNLIHSYNFPDTAPADGQNITPKDGIQLTARYVGLKVKQPAADGTIALDEFNVYGRKNSSTVDGIYTTNGEIDLGESLCTYATATVFYKKSTDGGEFVSETLNGTRIDTKTYDNDFSTDFTTDPYFAKSGGVDYDVYIDGTNTAKQEKHIIDIEYFLGRSRNFDKILVASGNGGAALGRYIVYASYEKANLYKDSSIVAEYNNSEDYAGCTYNKSVQVFTLNTPATAKYIALRIVDPRKDHSGASKISDYAAVVKEFNIYKSDFSVSYGSATEVYTSSYIDAVDLSESLIGGKDSMGTTYADGTSSPFQVSGEGHLGDSDKTDKLGSYAVTAKDCPRFDVSWAGVSYNDNGSLTDDDTKLYQQVDYQLDKEAQISRIAIFGHGDSELNFSHIKLIFSKTEEGLYNLDSENTTVCDIHNSSGASYVLVTPDTEEMLRAKYFAVRIVCGVGESAVTLSPESCYGRIRHIALFGKNKDDIIHFGNTEIVGVKAPDCTSKGYTGDKVCNDCGEILEKGKSIPALGHKLTTKTTKATLSANGKIVTSCTVCKAVTSTKTISRIKTVKLSTTSYTYSGSSKKPSVTVKDYSGKTLKNGTDYTVSYKNNKSVGTATATVTFKGNYSGTKSLNFTIKPKTTSLSKLTAGKKQLKVTWKKNSAVSGYQIQYSTSKKFTSPKTVTVKGYKTTSKTIKNLKAKKTYYVRVRTYKTVDGKKVYSDWSKKSLSKKTK